MLQKLQKTFNSVIKSLEIIYLLENIKPAARIMVKEEEMNGVMDVLEKHNLYYAISDFKVIKQDKEKSYSDKAIKVAIKAKEKGHLFVYISKQKGLAKKAKELEKNNKHKELGILLGYPKCCSEFFEKNFEEQSKKQNDYTLPALKNSDGFTFPFYTNIAARHFDLALLNHFPCSFNCKDSIELAKKHLKTIKKHSKEYAEIIEGMLKGAVVYTETGGVFLLRYPLLKHNRLYFKGIMATKSNQLYTALKNADCVRIVGKNRILLDNLQIKDVGVMVFT